jgi:hypothetical protein
LSPFRTRQFEGVIVEQHISPSAKEADDAQPQLAVLGDFHSEQCFLSAIQGEDAPDLPASDLEIRRDARPVA